MSPGGRVSARSMNRVPAKPAAAFILYGIRTAGREPPHRKKARIAIAPPAERRRGHHCRRPDGRSWRILSRHKRNAMTAPCTPCRFLPTTLAEVRQYGWDALDVILVCGDTYIDSPHMGTAVIGRVLVDAGYRVGILAQPDIHSDTDIERLGEPLLFWGVSAGRRGQHDRQPHCHGQTAPQGRSDTGRNQQPASRPGGDRL